MSHPYEALLLQVLGTGSLSHRVGAALALGYLKSSSARDLFEVILKDSTEPVRVHHACLQALVIDASEASYAAIFRLLSDERFVRHRLLFRLIRTLPRNEGYSKELKEILAELSTHLDSPNASAARILLLEWNFASGGSVTHRGSGSSQMSGLFRAQAIHPECREVVTMILGRLCT